MLEWKDQAIILRLGHFHDADIWCRALVRKHGLHTVFAFGGAKSRHRFCGCLDILNILDSRITGSRRTGYLTLQEATLLQGPRKLRKDWRGMGIVANCLQFVDKLAIGPDNAPASFELVQDLCSLMEKKEPVSSYVPIFFRLRMVSALGYAPDFAACASCGASLTGAGLFLANEGRLFCAKCARERSYADKKHGFPLQADTSRLLCHAQQMLPSQWRLEDFSAPAMRQAARAIDGFVQFHVC